MTLIKVTDQDGLTRPGEPNALQWGAGVTHRAADGTPKLCSPTVIHAYEDILIAALLNPAHGGYEPPSFFTAEGVVVARDSLKVGCRQLTTIRQIAAPDITTEMRVRFAILCALAVYDAPAFASWANGWLSGADRTAQAARAAALAALAAAQAAEAVRRKAALAAARAAEARREAALAAALAAEAAQAEARRALAAVAWARREAEAVRRKAALAAAQAAVAWARREAAEAAQAAQAAAQAAEVVKHPIDFAALARQACQ